MVYLSFACGVSRDEIFKVRGLILGQFPKLQAETSWGHRAERDFRYFEIRDGLKR